jgi:tRNA dimethylallyltransferase
MVYYIPLIAMGANRARIISILGPTSTGKSELALFLAKSLDGEIVNGDSMQVYRHFNIGSAKPSMAEQREIPHHLIDVVNPDEEFNAALFQQIADDAIEDIRSRGRVPVVVGGTGLYLRALFHGLFPAKSNPDLRQRLRVLFRENPSHTYSELESRDPEYAASISPHDITRVVRGLEIVHLTGKSMSEWQKEHGFREERYEVLKLGLTIDRAHLYRRIDERVERMLEQGWIDEVRGLVDAGWDRSLKPFQGIGYREILLFLTGEMDYDGMVTAIKTSTRHYAKRQVTWFSKEKNVSWREYPSQQHAILDQARSFLE